MPDKKKTREEALRLLRQRAVNNAIKNEAQRDRSTRSPQTRNTSQTSNSSTSSGNSTAGSQRGSQSPSSASSKFYESARVNKGGTDVTDRYGSGSARGDYRGGTRSTITPYRERYKEEPRQRTNRDGYTVRGAVKQFAGGHLSSAGTALQGAETTARSYLKGKYESETDYRLRSREQAEERERNYLNDVRRKEGIDVRYTPRVYETDPNSFSQKLIRKGDTLISEGSEDIERAKEGLGAVGRLGVDLGANAIQMMGDRLLAFVPGVGQALAMGSLGNRAGGTASYEARQMGMNPDQQQTYALGTSMIEMLSEGIFNSVSAFQATYGKGAFSLADKVSTRMASTKIVQDFLKTEAGKQIAINLARLGAQGFEEGVEELVADITEPALKYALTHSSGDFSMEGLMGEYNAKDMAYDFLVGALMAGIPGAVEASQRVDRALTTSQAMRDGQLSVDAKIEEGLAQQRMAESGRQTPTNAEVLARQLQEQRAQGREIQASQVNMLEDAIAESRESNARAFEQRSATAEEQAVREGTIRRSTGTEAERTAYERGETQVVDRNAERARETMGENATPETSYAVANIITGTTATNDDIETVLTNKDARDAVETLTGTQLPINNAEARNTLEDLIVVNAIANKDSIRAEAQRTHADDIAKEVNMSKRGGKLFTEHYGEAVEALGSPMIYEEVFTRLYADGMIKDSDFNEVYDRLVAPLGERVTNYFTKEVALRAFNEGRIAMTANTAKASAREKAVKAENGNGLFVEQGAKKNVSEKTIRDLEKFAKRANVTIRLVETIPVYDENGKRRYHEDGKPMSANGMYSNGVITIASDADNKLIIVAKHELTHHIKKTAPKRYQELEDFVFKKWYHSDPKAMENKIRETQTLYQNISVEEAREEIIADASEAFFTDESAIQEVMSFSRKLGRAIHNGIHTLLDTFLALDEGDTRKQTHDGDFLKDLGILRDAEKMWAKALGEGVESRRSTEGTAEAESDEVFSIKDGKARWTEDRIDDLIKLYGASNEDYSRAYAVLMNPRDFLKLTLDDKMLEQWDKVASEGGSPSLRSLDQKDLANRREDAPYLQIYSNDGTMVQGHEGRHRMRALLEAGVTSVPVAIRDTDTKYSKVSMPSMTLSSQDFGYDPVNNNAKVTVKDLIPIKESNRAELIKKFGGEAEVKFSLKALDKDYMDAVNRGDMETAQQMVDEQAVKHGWKPRHLYHGTLAYGFTFFDKSKAHVGGNSGAGFYFSTEEDDSVNHYQDIEGADNYFKWSALADKIQRESVENGGEVISYPDAVELAKAQLNENPGTYNVYLKYDNPYIRNGRNSTDIKEILMRDFDESIIDRNDYEDEDDYEDDLRNYQDEHLLQALHNAVYGAYTDLENRYDIFEAPDISDLESNILNFTYDYDKLDWSDIKEAIDETWEGVTLANEDWDETAEGSTELTRAIIENLGFDAIVDKEVSQKFGQLSREMMTDTEHIIVFNPNQIKSATPVTYDDNGNVIPLSERFNEANEDIRYSVKETKTKNPNVYMLDKSGDVLTTSNGTPVAKFEKNGSVQLSLKTYEDKGRKVYKNYLNKLVKSGELSQKEADDMMGELETIYRISRDFADSGKFAPFTAWSEADVVVDQKGKPVFSSIKANSEYKMNIDFSTICKKRRTLDAVFRSMINRGLFENLDLNKDESASLVVNINNIIRDHDFETACALCFVEARRYRQQQTATAFRDMWNGLVESMYKDKSKIEYFNFGEDDTVKAVPDGIHTMNNKDLDLSYVRKVATERKPDGKLMQTAEAKTARLLLSDPSQRKLMRIGDMMASTGFENMQVKNPKLMKIYNAKKGTGGAKSSFGDVQYLNEIINSKTFDRRKAYAVSGVRIQSFSDYVPRMVFDYVQVIADLSAKKLPAHAYTKEVLFVKQFGLTGVKINMSLVPDVVAGGKAPGLDKNGNYVWNTDGTFPYKEALAIQKAEGYKENCGTIAVGISDEQIWKMLADPEIQMVIPYHKSSLNPIVAQMTNVDRFTDYTDFQNTKDADGKTVAKDFDWDNKLFELSHGKDGKLLPKSEWGDIQDLVQEYVDWCNERNYTPKFSQFLYMKDGTINPGYYKMLEDFALLDNEGNFKPQDDVRMNFPTDESAFGSMTNLIKQGLSEDTKLEKKRSKEIEGIVDEIEAELGKGTLTTPSFESRLLAEKLQIKRTDTTPQAYKNTIAKLEEKVADLKGEFKRTDLKTADPKQVRIQAGKLLNRHDANMSIRSEVEDTFKRIFKMYKENGTNAFDDVYELAKNTAVDVVNNISIVHDEGLEEYKAIKQYLKDTPITIDAEMKRNITDYNDFRKSNLGKLKLVNGDKSNVDNVYMELSELFPEQFTDDYINPVDQLYHIVDVLDNYAPFYENLDGASEEMQDYVVEIASDIMETAYGLQTKKTFADKKYEEKVKAVERAREKALASRDKALARQKERYEEKIEAIKAHNRQMAENKRARKEESETKTKLLRVMRRLNNYKTTAEMRKEIDSIIGEYDLIAKSLTGKTIEKLSNLSDIYESLKEDPDFIPDTNIENRIKRLHSKHIKDLTLEDARALYEILSNIENELRTSKKLINSEMKKEVKQLGLETMANINKSRGIAKPLKGIDRFFVNGTLSPLREIRRVTGYVDDDPLYIATKELADGQREMLTFQMNSWKAFDKFMKDKKFIAKLNGKNAEEIEVVGERDGKPYTVKITPDIRMAMYLSSLNRDNLRHIRDGGIRLPDIKLFKKGKIAEAITEGVVVRFSPSQLREITSHMTKEEKDFASEAYKFYNVISPQAINEVSEQLKGYSIAQVDDYYPIQTDKNFLNKEFDSMKFDGTIEGMGFLKERVESSIPIVMTGLVDTLTRSIDMTSKYVGLAIPVRNFNKLYNVSNVKYTEVNRGGVKSLRSEFNGSVQDSITSKWGDPVTSYIEKFMTDLQNGRKTKDDWEMALNKWRSHYAGAVLTLNASVAMKQTASYPTAMAVTGFMPLVKAMGNIGKVDLDLIAKYTPLQWYRSQGFSTTELGDIKSGAKGSILNKVPALNWIQGMDVLTTRKLWKASEYYVRKQNKNLKQGTDEYYKAVAEIYNRVIEETQPNYTTLQRPGLLRSDSSLVQVLNMFKTQPYQNFNILYDAIGNFTAKRKQYQLKKNEQTRKAMKDATRDLRNALVSQTIQLAVFSAMTALWAMFRRKDDKYRDDEGNITIASFMERLGLDMMNSMTAEVPFGSDIYGALSSVLIDETYYGFTSVTDSSITDLLDTMAKSITTTGEWVEYAKSTEEGKKPDRDMYKDVLDVANSASRFGGIPFSNLKNLVDAVYGWGAISMDGEYIGKYEALKMTLAKDSEKKALLFRAYRNDKKAYDDLRRMMIDDGFEAEKLDAYLKKKIKDNPSKEEEANYEKSMEYLKKNSLWDMDSLSKETYEANLRKIALGIEDSDTAPYTKYENIGITPEENVLIRLAMEKADKTRGNANGYLDADEKKEALKLLTSLNLSAREKEAILDERWSYKKKG